jgi:hypothetical protein
MTESVSRRRSVAFPLIAVLPVTLAILLLFNGVRRVPFGFWDAFGWRRPLVLTLAGVNVFPSGPRPWLPLFMAAGGAPSMRAVFHLVTRCGCSRPAPIADGVYVVSAMGTQAASEVFGLARSS